MERYRLSFAGSGKVAASIIPSFLSCGHTVLQLYARSPEKGNKISAETGARFIDKPEFEDSNDFVVVAVSDSALETVLASIRCSENTVVVHTAGSYGMEIFPQHIKRRGVFYPLQTFSLNRRIEMSGVPVFIEASDEVAAVRLEDLARSIGAIPLRSTPERRQLLHVAAVFVSNFTNFMLTAGESISARAGFEPEILEPLINETVSKALSQGASRSQTGPAVRNDMNTVEKHIDLLSFSPELQTLYGEITRSIIQYYKTRGRNE